MCLCARDRAGPHWMGVQISKGLERIKKMVIFFRRYPKVERGRVGALQCLDAGLGPQSICDCLTAAMLKREHLGESSLDEVSLRDG